MSLSLNEKIVFLNKLSDDTLILIRYAKWELSSYGEGSLFSLGGSIGPVRAKNFDECIDKAFILVWEKIANG